MKLKSASIGAPAALLLLSGAAHADLTPFSFGAQETIEHESNVNHTAEAQAAWLSTTELRAAMDELLGRQHLLANAQVDFNRYTDHGPNNTSYQAGTELDWSTIGDLSGAIGASSQRRRYLYGFSGESVSPSNNLETDNRAFARAQLGGPGRWVLFGGADATERRYSNALFNVNEENQWSVNGGTRYQTSPDLSFGITGEYTRGKYPNVPDGLNGFNLRSLDLTSMWQATGNSQFNLRTGYTQEREDGRPDNNYWNGDLGWSWTPPSHFKVTIDIARDSDANTAALANAVSGQSNLTGRSINTTFNANVTYSLTAKTSLVAGFQYAKRRYAPGTLPLIVGAPEDFASGTNRTSQLSLSAHYLPTVNSDVSCGVTREVRHSDASIVEVAPSYTATDVLCSAQIQFK
jgi:hypothetical protein